jgi:Uma2 family endonuclease
MATPHTPIQPGASSIPQPQGRKRWTIDEYYRLGELGFFRDQHVELLEGDIIVMTPKGFGHVLARSRAARILKSIFEPTHWVLDQDPLRLLNSEPEPDIAVVPGPESSYSAIPTAALLIIEVSDSSLDYDCGEKASFYAAADITDYWVLNLVDRQLELFRDPQPDPGKPFGHGYASVTAHPPGASVSPLAAPQASIPIADLLP